MKTAILIGFHYEYANEEYRLSGIDLDLYRAYKYANHIKCDNILIITDSMYIEKYQNDYIYQMIIKGDIDKDFLNFDKLIGDNIILNTDPDIILRKITEYTYKTHLLYIYYTGHAISGNMILPNKTKNYHEYDRLMVSAILNVVSPNVKQILFLLDCCRSSGLNLAFSLHEDHINYNIDAQHYDRYDILCISSTDINKDSTYISYQGSIFTNIFFKYFLDNSIKTLYNLYRKMSQETHISIKSNIPRWLNKKVGIWSWLLNKSKCCVYYDPILHTIDIIF